MACSRRRFLQVASSGLTAGLTAPRVLLGASDDDERKKLANRRRRIIFNDDGDDVWHPDAKTPEGFVSVRLRHMLNTQVDTLFYCTTQSFNSFTHHTRVGEVFVSREGPFQHNNMQTLMDAGTDPLKLAVEYAHKHGFEAIWTLRMNDIHDAFTPPMFPKWKKDRPDALLGKPDDWGKTAPSSQQHWWSGVDYQRDDVHQRVIELIDEVVRQYDVDGIDLDWLRNPIHFPETLAGKPTTRAQLDRLTELTRRIRTRLIEAGQRRKRPILLSARVPVTIERCLYMGVDIEAWLKAGLIDLLGVGGGYTPFSMPIADVISLSHRYGVPVYPCISMSGMLRRKPYGNDAPYPADGWRAAASNAFLAGADGISLFNLFPEPGSDAHNQLVRTVFSEAGEPRTLAGKDKLFCLDNSAHMANCGYINHVVSWRHCLPKPIEPGSPLLAPLPIGDDPASARSATLRVQLDNPATVRCRLNERDLTLNPADDLTKQIGGIWYTAPLDPRLVRKGRNLFDIEHKTPPEKPVSLTGLELAVGYDH